MEGEGEDAGLVWVEGGGGRGRGHRVGGEAGRLQLLKREGRREEKGGSSSYKGGRKSVSVVGCYL
jgi:hypothetical protein